MFRQWTSANVWPEQKDRNIFLEVPLVKLCVSIFTACLTAPSTTVGLRIKRFTEGILFLEAFLRTPLRSLMDWWLDPAHSHRDALRVRFSLAQALCSFLARPRSPALQSTFNSSSVSDCSAPSFFLPNSYSSNSPEHLHCNTLTVSHTPEGHVQLVHYVSWVVLRLMENTRNALVFHHFPRGKRNSQSTCCQREMSAFHFYSVLYDSYIGTILASWLKLLLHHSGSFLTFEMCLKFIGDSRHGGCHRQ